MPRSDNLVIVERIRQRRDGSRIEARFDSTKKSGELFERELLVTKDSSQMMLHAPNSGFPNATKVSRGRGKKVPRNAVRGGLVLEVRIAEGSVIRCREFAISPDERCAVVRVH